MHDFLNTLLFLTLGGSVMTVLVLLIQLIFRKKLPRTFCYCAWLLVLLRFALPVPGIFRVSPETAQAVRTPQALQSSLQALREHPEKSEAFTPAEKDPAEDTHGILSGTEADARTETIHTASVDVPDVTNPTPEQSGLSLSQRLLILWAAGAAVCAGLYIVSYLRFSRILNRTLRQPEQPDRQVFQALGGKDRLQLWRSPCVSSPMQLGLLSPRLILPDRAYTKEMLENILRHELTHYRRRDVLCKWAAALTGCIHWFNPFVWIARRQLDRQCELSCDELLLKSMTPQEKQSYGQTLLELACDRALPKQVIATSFATEKRYLKERLGQIMDYRGSSVPTMILTLCLSLVLTGCAVASGPVRQAEPTEEPPQTAVPAETKAAPQTETASKDSGEEDVVYVSTVDELLTAIAPNTTILLAPGTYDLTQASDYPIEDIAETRPRSDYLLWENNGVDGYGLVVNGVDNLTIRSESGAGTILCSQPRYSEVLRFSGCTGITITSLTAGHTEGAGTCVGAVFGFCFTDDVVIEGCGLYGCGTMGVEAWNCENMLVHKTHIYDCSLGAAGIYECYNVRFDSCAVDDCTGYQGLFTIQQSASIAVTNTAVRNNETDYLVSANNNAQDVYFGGVQTDNCTFSTGIYDSDRMPITFDGCAFAQTNLFPEDMDTPAVLAVDGSGKALENQALMKMTLSENVNWEPKARPTLDAEKSTIVQDGVATVSTVDELIAAIGPDTTILLQPGTYTLSEASNYGQLGGDYYRWAEEFDGYTLEIRYVDNLTIVAKDPSRVQIETSPRYADVLRFQSCTGITLDGFTAGHIDGLGSCTGNVLGFYRTDEITVKNCSLFGCGVIGIDASLCTGMTVMGTEIHHCESSAASLWNCQDVSFTDCNIHDNGDDHIHTNECANVSIDRKSLIK